MLLSYRSVHSVQHILADRFQLANQRFALCLTFDHDLAVSGLAAIVRKAQKVEGLRAALPGSCSALDGEPPERYQPGLVLVDRQAELLQPVSQCREELLPHRPFQGGQGRVRAAPRPKAVAKPKEVRLAGVLAACGLRSYPLKLSG